jgi:hypothetical protein
VELDVVGGRSQDLRVVAELTQPTVAVEAQDRSHSARGMVVVDMSGGRRLADGTYAVLLPKQVVRLGCRNPVAPREVV